MEADTDAINIIGEAQKALKEFYERPSSFLKVSRRVSISEKAPPKAPSVSWEKEGKYDGQKSKGKGVIIWLDIIKEDLQNTIAMNKREEEQSKKAYEESVALMEKAVKVKKEKRLIIKKELAELGESLADKQASLSDNAKDTAEAEEMTKALTTDCLWVKSSFDTRRKKRKAEIEGLQQAKINLSNAGEGLEDDSLDLN